MDRWPAVVAVLICLLSSATFAGPAAAVADGGETAGPAPPVVSHASSAAFAPTTADVLSGSRTANVAPTESPVSGTPSEVAITVFANGSAKWMFRYRTRLQNDSEKQNFREYADRFESQRTQLYREFIADARALTADAENVTGRSMNATSFSRTAHVETGALNEFGVVSMSFHWTNFGQQVDQRVIVGDVFEGGLYLAPDQRLVISPGPTLRFRSIAPGAVQSNPDSLRKSDSITYTGERRFTDNRPHVVFVPGEKSAQAPPQDTGTATTLPTDGLTSRYLPLLFGGLFLAVGVGAWAYRRILLEETVLFDSSGPEGLTDATGADVDGGTDADGNPSTSPVSEGTSDAADSDAPGKFAGDSRLAGGVTTADASSDGPTTDEPAVSADESSAPSVTAADLQSDEDRVVSLLGDHGGRMRQSQIVEETGWSKSKVSMLLSDMDEEGLVSKLRLGRENVISLPGNEPSTEGDEEP